MKILYGIQGTGNGHLTRAMEILPVLQKQGKVDVLISGVHSELELPVAPKYKMHGMGFVFGKKGGIDLVETYRRSRIKKFYNEVVSLKLSKYDLIISDFEPITAWAAMKQQRKAIGLSNQVSLLHPLVPKAKNEDLVGKFIIRNYAPTAINIGLSYAAFGTHVYTPIIRSSLREASLTQEGHYVVYLPSYGDEKLLAVLSALDKSAPFHVFSKYTSSHYVQGNITVHPLNKDLFEQMVTSASGVITAAGFGTTTEALFMGKKLLVVPQKHQYEQACNALALKEIGITVVKSFKLKHIAKIEAWLKYAQPIKLDYPNLVEEMLDDAAAQLINAEDPYADYLVRDQYLLKTA